MKKGDVVIIRDWSFSVGVKNGKLDRYYPPKGFPCNHYVIVETDCKFPPIGTLQGLDFYGTPASFNDTVIQDMKTGDVIFIEKRFLKLVEPRHKIMIDFVSGQHIEISDELYNKILDEQTPIHNFNIE